MVAIGLKTLLISVSIVLCFGISLSKAITLSDDDQYLEIPLFLDIEEDDQSLENLLESQWQDDSLGEEDLTSSQTWELRGTLEQRYGRWLRSYPSNRNPSVNESRLHLNWTQDWQEFQFELSPELLYDWSQASQRLNFDQNQGWFQLRAASISWSPLSFLDLKIGRQIITWGTGDLVFINDLFPKDWNSFIIGRADSYLKAPFNSFKISLYQDLFNVDLVYTPRFEADLIVDGQRASYYNPMLSSYGGFEQIIVRDTPKSWFKSAEWALRIHKNIRGTELAFYSYRGYWKTPSGFRPQEKYFFYPKLAVYGTSLRKNLGVGIVNFEYGYYDSLDDPSATNPFIDNSQQRLLIGYEQELFANVTLACQYYVKEQLDYEQYLNSLQGYQIPVQRYRHEFTQRLTWRAMHQKLLLPLFNVSSLNDEDGHLRLQAKYQYDDFWSFEIGLLNFYGINNETFFGQFDQNDNGYVAVQYGF